MPILGVEFEAARARADEAQALMDKLEEARSCAAGQRGRAATVAWLNSQICALQTEWQEAKTIVHAYRRQEGQRDETREVTALMQSRTRGRIEQLMLACPEGL